MRQRLITIIATAIGIAAVAGLMVLSGIHDPNAWLRWVLRSIALVSATVVELMIIAYWARTPSRRHRSPMGAETENYPE